MSLNLNDIITDGTSKFQVVKSATDLDITNKINNLKNQLGYRKPNTNYVIGNITYHASLPIGWYLECTTAGISGNNDLTINSPTIGSTINDGTVVWMFHNVMDLKASYITTDCNTTITGCALIDSSNTENKPNGLSNGVLLTTGSRNWLMQFASAAYPPTDKIYSRKFMNNTWTTWVQQEAIVKSSFGTNGYIEYASGLIIQWGIATHLNIDDGQNTFSMSLPISFPNKNLFAIGTVSTIYASRKIFFTINSFFNDVVQGYWYSETNVLNQDLKILILAIGY